MLTEAALNGKNSWSALEIVISRATAEDESCWLERAQTLTINLLTVCSRCHRLIHAGVIRVNRDDGRGLLWTDREGRELAWKTYEEPAAWWDVVGLDGRPWRKDWEESLA